MQAELISLYGSAAQQCGCNPGACLHAPEHLPNLSDADAADWETIFNDWATHVYRGNNNIHLPSYFKTAQRLAQGLMQGVGTDYTAAHPSNTLAAGLRSNLYQFSGAKNYFEQRLMAGMLTDQNGDKLPFKQYLNKVKGLHKTYNERYLAAEYQHAITSAQMGVKWKNFETLGVEWLEYSTVGDERVRKSHAALDGLTLPANSPVWDRIYPPNDWGCRCSVVPAFKPSNPLSDAEAGKLGKQAVGNSPIFNTNVGKTELAFTKGHPYFKGIDKKLHQLDAEKHYGMPSIGTIMSKAQNLPSPIVIDDYDGWWQKMVNTYGSGNHNFELKDKVGMKVLFDKSPDGKNAQDYFHGHITRKGEGREILAANLYEIFTDPDELWTKGFLDNQEWHYIKYFNDGPYILTVLRKKGIPTAETYYKIDQKRWDFSQRKDRDTDGKIRGKRTGILLHKKTE